MVLGKLKYGELKYTAKTLRTNKGKYQQGHGAGGGGGGGEGGEYCGGRNKKGTQKPVK